MKALFWCDLSKKVERSHQKNLRVIFCKPLAPFFEVKQHWVPFFPDFQGFCPDFSGIFPGFSTKQNYWG